MIEITDILLSYYRRCNAATIDSRQISELKNAGRKVMFFALKGEKYDGNDFITAALEDGADFVITDNINLDGTTNKKVLVVRNVLKAMQDLAQAYRRSLPVKIVAITGTNGKTTTKELVYKSLSKKYKAYATVGNLNNHIGVPLTILNMPKETDVAIIEMGANHVGEIKLLCSIAEPNYGLITNIGKAHLEGFGSYEGIIKAKGELFDFIKRTGGIAIYDSSDKVLAQMIDARGGIRKSAYNSSEFSCSQDDKGELVFRLKSKSLEINSSLTGSYNMKNVAAAYTIARAFGIEYTTFVDAVESYYPTNNRSQLIHKKSVIVIADAYNANPSSMECAITNLKEFKGTSKIAILGDMKELGESSPEEHRKIVKMVQKCDFKNVYFIGEEFEQGKIDSDNLHYYHSTDDFLSVIKTIDFSGSVVLVKGSHSMSLEKVTVMVY